MPTLTEDIASFAATIRRADMPREDVAAIQRLVLDTLGCALGAVGCPPVRMLAPLLRAPAGDSAVDSASLIGGSGTAVSLESAILHNGTLVRYLDFMDVYWARDICHPSENIPLALAAAQAVHASGAALIEAIAVAYEVQVRLADAFSLEGIGLHHVSAAGFVAPLVLGKLWGLTDAPLANAMALGGFRHLTHASLVKGRLSMAKAIGYAVASAECVASTRLAAQGFTGPLEVLSEMGVLDFDRLPGTGCARRVSLKQFPVQYTLQSPVEAALRLRTVLPGSGADVAALRVEVHADVCRRTADAAKRDPANRETADHSLPCCVAMALLDGRLDSAQFDDDRWRAADVRALMQRIDVVPSAALEQRWPTGRPARLVATLADGATREVLVDTPLGDAQRPMDDDAIARKFMALATPVLGAERAGAVVRMVMALDTLQDVGALCALLQANASPSH
jgi:2-methylcitrate dehydratase